MAFEIQNSSRFISFYLLAWERHKRGNYQIQSLYLDSTTQESSKFLTEIGNSKENILKVFYIRLDRKSKSSQIYFFDE